MEEKVPADRWGTFGRLVCLRRKGLQDWGSLPLDKTKFTIGREDGHDLRLRRLACSRTHAEITVGAQNKVYLEDLDSGSGTFLNDEQLAPGNKKELQSNDIIEIYDRMFRFEYPPQDNHCAQRGALTPQNGVRTPRGRPAVDRVAAKSPARSRSVSRSRSISSVGKPASGSGTPVKRESSSGVESAPIKEEENAPSTLPKSPPTSQETSVDLPVTGEKESDAEGLGLSASKTDHIARDGNGDAELPTNEEAALAPEASDTESLAKDDLKVDTDEALKADTDEALKVDTGEALKVDTDEAGCTAHPTRMDDQAIEKPTERLTPARALPSYMRPTASSAAEAVPSATGRSPAARGVASAPRPNRLSALSPGDLSLLNYFDRIPPTAEATSGNNGQKISGLGAGLSLANERILREVDDFVISAKGAVKGKHVAAPSERILNRPLTPTASEKKPRLEEQVTPRPPSTIRLSESEARSIRKTLFPADSTKSTLGAAAFDLTKSEVIPSPRHVPPSVLPATPKMEMAPMKSEESLVSRAGLHDEDNNLLTDTLPASPRTAPRKVVTFGPLLSPEVFHRDDPPATPIRRGRRTPGSAVKPSLKQTPLATSSLVQEDQASASTGSDAEDTGGEAELLLPAAQEVEAVQVGSVKAECEDPRATPPGGGTLPLDETASPPEEQELQSVTGPDRLNKVQSEGDVNLVGVRELMNTPARDGNAMNLVGVREMLRTPVQSEGDGVNLVGVREMLKTPGLVRADEANLVGVRELVKTPTHGGPPMSLVGVREMLKTPGQVGADEANLVGVREMLKTPVRSEEDEVNLVGVREMLKTPGQVGAYDVNLVGVREMMKTPKLKEQHPDVSGVAQLFESPVVESGRGKVDSENEAGNVDDISLGQDARSGNSRTVAVISPIRTRRATKKSSERTEVESVPVEAPTRKLRSRSRRILSKTAQPAADSVDSVTEGNEPVEKASTSEATHGITNEAAALDSALTDELAPQLAPQPEPLETDDDPLIETSQLKKKGRRSGHKIANVEQSTNADGTHPPRRTRNQRRKLELSVEPKPDAEIPETEASLSSTQETDLSKDTDPTIMTTAGGGRGIDAQVEEMGTRKNLRKRKQQANVVDQNTALNEGEGGNSGEVLDGTTAKDKKRRVADTAGESGPISPEEFYGYTTRGRAAKANTSGEEKPKTGRKRKAGVDREDEEQQRSQEVADGALGRKKAKSEERDTERDEDNQADERIAGKNGRHGRNGMVGKTSSPSDEEDSVVVRRAGRPRRQVGKPLVEVGDGVNTRKHGARQTSQEPLAQEKTVQRRTRSGLRKGAEVADIPKPAPAPVLRRSKRKQ
ncbi:hypothetical protein HK104_010223 [Borealophlyctis nickersoniae]|nr:hypothetical protein HK104_010223 [Borealophlyctis nickersoniae]